MSNGSASAGRGDWSRGTNTNSASGSMKRRISQAQPIRSTPTCSQVTHVIGLPSLSRLPTGREQRLADALAERGVKVILTSGLLVPSGERREIGFRLFEIAEDAGVEAVDQGQELANQIVVVAVEPE